MWEKSKSVFFSFAFRVVRLNVQTVDNRSTVHMEEAIFITKNKPLFSDDKKFLVIM